MGCRRSAARRACLGALLGAAALVPVWAAPTPDFAALRALHAKQGLAVSALAVDLPSGRTVAAMAPRARLIAASLTKLYTAAAALQRWGPQHRFVTRLDYRGRRRGRRLRGDLILQGGGDPGLVKEQLWLLAQRVRQTGLRTVSGDLIVDQSLFGRVGCSARDRCAARDGSEHAYNAPLSAAGVDFGTWCVAVTPAAEAGHPARVALCPPVPALVGLHGMVQTVRAQGPGDVTVRRTTSHRSDRLTVAGRVPVGSPARRYYVAASEPARLTGGLLRVLLAQAGVRVDGRVRVVSDPVPFAKPLVALKGSTLGHEIAMMLQYSNNYMADTLALDLDRAGQTSGALPTLRAAGRRLAQFAAAVNQATAIRPRPPRRPPTLASGSGLTTANRLCASDLVALLDHMYHATALFPAYLGGLSVPQSAPLTLVRGGTPAWMQRVAVKTGSLNEPVSVLNVAGYYRTAGGGWRAFAVLVNGTRDHPHFPWWEAMNAIKRDVAHLSAAAR